MEAVLDIYRRPHDPLHPVVCMDESPKQLIAETRQGMLPAPGRPARFDYEYRRCGTCNVFMACEPLAGKRHVSITGRRTKQDWAQFVTEVADHYPDAEQITLVMDNLNTHTAGALYETFPPDQARALSQRFNFVYTPKHGSWLNMAEIELNVLNRQCLNRRIDNRQEVISEVAAWQDNRNNADATVNWQFTAADARIKLKRLYPSLDT